MIEELQIPDKARKAYEWCSQLTSESQKEITSYVWPKEIKNLLTRLGLLAETIFKRFSWIIGVLYGT